MHHIDNQSNGSLVEFLRLHRYVVDKMDVAVDILSYFHLLDKGDELKFGNILL